MISFVRTCNYLSLDVKRISTPDPLKIQLLPSWGKWSSYVGCLMSLKYSPSDFSLRLKLFQPQHLPCHFSPVQPHAATIYPLHTKAHVVLRIHSSLPSLAQPTSSENTLSSFLAWEPSLYLLRLGPSIILWDDYPNVPHWVAAPRIFCNHLAQVTSTMAFMHFHHVKFNKWTFKWWISKIKDTSHALYLPTVQWGGKLNNYHTVNIKCRPF